MPVQSTPESPALRYNLFYGLPVIPRNEESTSDMQQFTDSSLMLRMTTKERKVFSLQSLLYDKYYYIKPKLFNYFYEELESCATFLANQPL